MGYWEERQAKTHAKLTSKSIKETEVEMKKYYQKSLKDVLSQFEATYDKLLLTVEEGREPTPADLYKLDKYWKMQNQLGKQLQKLGDQQSELFRKKFMEEYAAIYEASALKDDLYFSKVNTESAEQMINQIWCADGKSWSQRVWTNTDQLRETLNDTLIHCVLTGKKTSEMKQLLMKQFNVSYNRADTIVRTEMAHIETQAARQRYEDYGIKEVEILVSPDERTCPICGKLDGKRIPIGAQMPVPSHPLCRCAIIPVIPDNK